MKLSRRLFKLPCARNGQRQTITLDQRSEDRMAWVRHVCKLALKVEPGRSVVIRCALVRYVVHLEQLMAEGRKEQLAHEAARLRQAARGNRQGLPEDELVTVPPKPFSAIERDAHEARMERDREEIAAMLRDPFPFGRPDE